jgi:hypothetical protein
METVVTTCVAPLMNQRACHRDMGVCAFGQIRCAHYLEEAVM